MDEHGKDHQISGPSVNRPDQPAELYLRHQKLYGLIGLAGAGAIIEQKKNAGGDLNHKEKQRHPAEIIPKRVPVHRHLFLLGEIFDILQPDSFIEPVPQFTVLWAPVFHA